VQRYRLIRCGQRSRGAHLTVQGAELAEAIEEPLAVGAGEQGGEGGHAVLL